MSINSSFDKKDEDFSNDRGIFISCETLKELQQLVYVLIEKKILISGMPFALQNVPTNMDEILNDEHYFDPVEIEGIQMIKGQLRHFEKPLIDLL